METTQTSTIASIDSRSAWRKTDTMWMMLKIRLLV